MTFDADSLYRLLPAIYRVRDAEQGGPLEALLSAVAEQVAVLQDNLVQLYDDQFIETCADWVVPYIGDLLGYRGLEGVAPSASRPRAAVAHTIGYRRRKGTAAVLEQLARDLTGWSARVVEGFRLLATTQYLNHVRAASLAMPDLRRWEPLERLGTPFETTARTLDVRRAATARGPYNIPDLGIFLWRLGSYPLTGTPAFKLDDRRYLLSPLGTNLQLFNRPEARDEVWRAATPREVPAPLSRRVAREQLADYYAPGKLVLTVDDVDVPVERVRICDLSDAAGDRWAHQPPAGTVGLDPVLGRVAFPATDDPPARVRSTFHYGFGADLGGGEYERGGRPDGGTGPVRRVVAPATITEALAGLGGAGTVEVGDSGRYAETPALRAAAGGQLTLRAANHTRPLLVLGGELSVEGEGAEVTIDGLAIAGAALHVGTGPRVVRLRHCTLVPGLGRHVDGAPRQPSAPSLVVDAAGVTVEIDHCVVGGLRVAEDASVRITSSIVDAAAATNVALAAPDDVGAGGRLLVENTTVVGKIHTRLLDLASNTLFVAALAPSDPFAGPVWSERTQAGCVRFSYVPPGSRVPRRYRCQPDGSDAVGVRPQFTSLSYGDPGYGQLSRRCAAALRQGADDGSEMGAFHDLLAPRREAALRAALDEYLRLGLEATVFYAT